MKIIEPSYKILTPISDGGQSELRLIETVARTCYKSEGNNEGDFDKTKKFIKGLIKRGHDAMLEHSFLSVKFVCDRGVSHELVRHRHGSFAQESTRYCNYSNDKFGNELTFVEPWWFKYSQDDFVIDDSSNRFINFCKATETVYLDLVNKNCLTPQAAREILINSIKTEIVVTTNYREWRHILNLRAANATGPAHPDMNRLMCPLLQELKESIPIMFDDVYDKMLDDKQAAQFIEGFKIY